MALMTNDSKCVFLKAGSATKLMDWPKTILVMPIHESNANASIRSTESGMINSPEKD